MIWIKLLWLFGIVIASGILGRMGGAKGYSTYYRDIGCSILAVAALCLFLGFKWDYWWVYICIFGLHWGAFSTYWDDTKNKVLDKICRTINWMYPRDNLWLSGFITGIAMMPAVFIVKWIWWVLLLRAILLAVVWGSLNKWLPQKVLWWRRDVAEEFLRYAVSQ
jgi:hypothetical protein